MSTRFAILKIVTVSTILLATVAGRSISKPSWPLQERKTKEAKAPLNQELELKPNDDSYPEIGRPELLKISADRLLVTVNDTLYLLNNRNVVVCVGR